jgi:hypothetical protein
MKLSQQKHTKTYKNIQLHKFASRFDNVSVFDSLLLWTRCSVRLTIVSLNLALLNLELIVDDQCPALGQSNAKRKDATGKAQCKAYQYQTRLRYVECQ